MKGCKALKIVLWSPSANDGLQLPDTQMTGGVTRGQLFHNIAIYHLKNDLIYSSAVADHPL